jgi:hypothetical protein
MVAASPVASVARAVSGFTRSFFRPVQSLAAKGRPFGATELASGVPEEFVGKRGSSPDETAAQVKSSNVALERRKNMG